jgi:hypothetical protein
MSPDERHCVLMRLAAEAMLPALEGCAAPPAGPELSTVSRLAEAAVDHFGPRIAEGWRAWFAGQPEAARRAALAELAALPVEAARRIAVEVLNRLAPGARPEDRDAAAGYLAALPATLGHGLPGGAATGDWAPDGTESWERSDEVVRLLPAHAAPYATPFDLPGTPYRLEQLLGAGGFGAVYRATARSLQHLPLAVKFCLDPHLLPALHLERSNLERLLKAGGEDAARRVVRLYGYDFDHATPYLVYEYVPGGDLIHWLARRRRQAGRPLTADEALGVIAQVVEALAFAHRHGLVHRDLKPANILADGDVLKLADFGLGGAAAARSSAAESSGPASRFRGAGTPLYMSPEQRLGARPDPRHDLYSLGVMWFQLLIGDVNRPLHPAWADEATAQSRVPRADVALIERCIGRFDLRPRDAGELAALLRMPGAAPDRAAPEPPAVVVPVAAPRPPARPADDPVGREPDLLERLKHLRDRLAADAAARRLGAATAWSIPWAVMAFVGVFLFGEAVHGLVWWRTPKAERPAIDDFPTGAYAAAAGGAVAFLILARGFGIAWRERGRRALELEDMIERTADAFPDRVTAWGGPAVLRDDRAVGDLVRRLRRGEPVDAWAPPGRVAAPGRAAMPMPVGAAPLLAGLLRAHDDLAWCNRRQGRGQFVLVGLAAGVAGGWLVGALYYAWKFPASSFLTVLAAAPLDGEAAACGAVGGVLLGAAAVVGLHVGWQLRLERARRGVDDGVRRLAARFRPEVQAWGGPAVLRDREAVADLLHGPERPHNPPIFPEH